MTRTHCALVPNGERNAVLTVGGGLPVLQADTRHQFKALEALKRSLHLDADFLRLAARTEDALVHQFDAPADAWKPRPPGEWLPLEDADAAALAPAGTEAAVELWLAELRGTPVDPQRPPWARPGWFGDASAWVSEQVAIRGKPKLIRQWPLSAVYRFETDDRPVYLKAVFTLFQAEPAVTEALAREHPGDVPDVLATDVDRGWMLMRALRGKSARGPQALDGVRTAARIQRAWSGRAAELASLGCRRRGLDEIAGEAAELAPLCDELAALDLPETIVHGDLHHGNMLVTGERTAVIDWSDAAIGHPFLDLAPVLWIGEKQRDALAAAYIDEWRRTLRAAAVGEALGCVYQAISYRAINDALEPADRWVFGDSYVDWRTRALDLGKALQPG
jgi:aminoglycoside phosphotransferase